MKKIIYLLSLSFLFWSCKKEAEQDFGTQSSASEETEKNPIAAGKKLFEGKGMCASCHLPNKKVIGPSIIEITQIYREQNADIIAFLKEEAKPIVDPSQYEVMKANFAVTKTMSTEELEAIEAYMYSIK
jgi:cytochrome c